MTLDTGRRSHDHHGLMNTNLLTHPHHHHGRAERGGRV